MKRGGISRDARRTADLEQRGYRVIRFWNNDVLGNVEGVMETIAAAVRAAGPPPPTPPRHASHGGRGEARLRRRPISTMQQQRRGARAALDDPPRRPRRRGRVHRFRHCGVRGQRGPAVRLALDAGRRDDAEADGRPAGRVRHPDLAGGRESQPFAEIEWSNLTHALLLVAITAAGGRALSRGSAFS